MGDVRAHSEGACRGMFVAVVGPSGSGKDTVLRGAMKRFADRGDIVFPQRVITRPAGDDNEDHIPVSVERFADMVANDAFSLWWRAHGLSYGVPKSVEHAVAAGQMCVVNLSRAELPAMRTRFPDAIVVQITVDPAVLEARLEARGRETPQEIARRLERLEANPPAGDDIVTIDNSGSPDTAIAAFCALVAGLADACAPTFQPRSGTTTR